MIRIKIARKKQSDVTELIAKGWRASVFRDADDAAEMITVEKGCIKFVLKRSATDPSLMELKKYVSGYYHDTKSFYEAGCGINGTICISEGKNSDATYAFFRNEKLQLLMDKFHLRKIIFPKEDCPKFDKDVYYDETAKYANEAYFDGPNGCFITDGSSSEEPSIEGTRKWSVANASYIYELATQTLTIPWKYDTDKLMEILSKIIK